MGRSKLTSVMVVMACVAGLHTGAARADEPTYDQLKQQITQLQSQVRQLEIELLKSKVQSLEARVEQLESAQADSEPTSDIDPEQVSQTTPMMAEPARSPDAAAIDVVTTVSEEAAADITDETVAADQATEELTLPISEDGVASTDQPDEQADADDVAPDTEVATASADDASDAQILEDELAVTPDETANVDVNSEAIQPVAPATQPVTAASVDQSASQADGNADAPALAQIDQAPLDDLPEIGANP